MIKIISFLFTDEDRTIETFTNVYTRASHCDPLTLIPMVVKQIDNIESYVTSVVSKLGFLRTNSQKNQQCRQVIQEFVKLTTGQIGHWVQWSHDNDEKISLVICSDSDWTQIQ